MSNGTLLVHLGDLKEVFKVHCKKNHSDMNKRIRQLVEQDVKQSKE